MSTKEVLQQTAAGSVGLAGITIPNLDSTADIFVGITPIASFFLIIIPTGIWAWMRAIKYMKRHFDKD